MELMYFTGAATFVFLALFLFGPIRLATIKLFAGKIVPISASDIPVQYVDSLIDTERFLVRNKFRLRCHVRRDAIMAGQNWGLYGAVYYHEEENTWALNFVEPIQSPVFSSRIIFLTRCSATNIVCTISGGEFEGLVSSSSAYQIQDALCYLPQQQLAHHQARLQRTSWNPPVGEINLDEVLDSFECLNFSNLVESNVLVKWHDGYRLSLRYVIKVSRRYKYVLRVLSHQKARYEERYKHRKSEDGTDRYYVEREINSYQTYCDIKNTRSMGWLLKSGILLGSVIVFGIAFGLSLSFHSVLILIAILFIHEAGHLFGMWMFGYKDLSILFIPFMGALANGRKQKVNAWQETIILLLGPLPGYILGILILTGFFGDPSDKWFEFGLMSIILNLFNLLPFTPLDGGKIVNLAFFARHPRAQLVFTGISILVFFYAGFAWQMYVLLLLAFLLLMSLPFQFKEAELLRRIVHKRPPLGDVHIERLIKMLNDMPLWQKLVQAERWSLLDSLIIKVQHIDVGLRSGVLIFCIWFFSMVLPPALLTPSNVKDSAGIFISSLFGHYPDIYSVEELSSQYRRSSDISEKANLAWQLLSKTGFDRSAGEGQSSEEFFRYLSEILDSDKVTQEDRGRYAMSLGALCDFQQLGCEVKYYEKAVSLYLYDKKTHRFALNSLDALISLPTLSYDEKLSYLSQIDALVEGDVSFSDWAVTASEMRGALEYERGNFSDVSLWLNKSVSFARTANIDMLDAQWLTLIRFYYGRGEVDLAIESARRWEKEFQINDTDYYTLAQTPEYVLIWLLNKHDPAAALARIDSIRGGTVANSIELLLARWTVESQLKAIDPQIYISELRSLVSQADENTWYDLSYSIGLVKLSVEEDIKAANKNNFYHAQHQMSSDWYHQMSALLLRPDLTFLRSRINRAYDGYSN